MSQDKAQSKKDCSVVVLNVDGPIAIMTKVDYEAKQRLIRKARELMKWVEENHPEVAKEFGMGDE